MAVKIRLQRKGRKQRPFYHIVIADARSKRDGRFIEKIGIYNPMTKPATIDLDRDKAFEWLLKGAQPTDTARAILRFKGVYYKKHLMRGVKKGALTQEQADVKYQEWIDVKEAKIAERAAKTLAENLAFQHQLAGTPPPPPKAPEPVVEAPVVEEVVAAVEETAAPEEVAVEETPVVAEAEETNPVAEVAEEAAEEEATEEEK